MLVGSVALISLHAQVVSDLSPADQAHVLPRNLSSPAGSPQPAGPHSSSLKVDVNLVLVPVTIQDDANRFIVGLGKDNFQVFDNKHSMEIQHLSREEGPVSVGIVLDVSGSMKNKIERARDAVLQFMQSANPQDEFFLVTFGDSPELAQGFTQSIADVQSRLPLLFPRGRTSLIDALYLAIRQMRDAHYRRRALLVISDGGDNHSRYTERELVDVIREADTLIYGIGIYDYRFATLEEREGPELLNEIASATGGQAFTVDNPNQLVETARYVNVALRNQYLIAYRPDKHPAGGKWRKIKVKLRALPRGLPPLHIRAKSGYYSAAE